MASEGERTSFVRDPDGRLVSMVGWDGDERFHYTVDGQNSVLALTAEDSQAGEPDAVYDYSPYGEQTGETIEDSPAADLNPFGYTGAYQFQDGTVHLSHRFLDTFTLNFTQADPSRQEMNNSTYAESNPINMTDPTGLYSIKDWFATVGIFAGGGGGVGGAIGCAVTGPACPAGAAKGAAIGGALGGAFGIGYATGEAIDYHT